MCRSIKPLFNFDPPSTDDDIRAAALQFVRKISGFTRPSKVNEEAFLRAVSEISDVSARLLKSLESNAQPKDRAAELAKKRARMQRRFATQ